MAEISWKNVSGRSDQGAGATMAAGVDRIMGVFDVGEDMIDDAHALQKQNEDQRGINLNKRIASEIQDVGDLGTLNQMEAEGQFKDSLLREKHGYQYDSAIKDQALNANRTTLQNALKNNLYSQAMEAADGEEDLLAGGARMRELAIAAGAKEETARGWENSFVSENTAKGQQYSKLRDERMLQTVADYKVDENTSIDDAINEAADLIDSGIKLDGSKLKKALRDKVITAHSDWSHKRKMKEIKDQDAQDALSEKAWNMGNQAVENSGDINQFSKTLDRKEFEGLKHKAKIALIGAAVPMLEQRSQLLTPQKIKLETQLGDFQSAINDKRSTFNGHVSGLRQENARMNGINTSIIKGVHTAAEQSKDPLAVIEHFFPGAKENFDSGDWTPINEMIHNLQYGKVEVDGKEVAFEFSPAEAQSAVIMGLEATRGQNGWVWHSFNHAAFIKAAALKASDLRTYQNESKRIDILESQYARELKQFDRDLLGFKGSSLLAYNQANLSKNKKSPEAFLKDMKISLPDGLSPDAVSPAYTAFMGKKSTTGKEDTEDTEDVADLPKNPASWSVRQGPTQPYKQKDVNQQIADSKASFKKAGKFIEDQVGGLIKQKWDGIKSLGNMVVDAQKDTMNGQIVTLSDGSERRLSPAEIEIYKKYQK